ncbi:MAG: dihydropteroate synthase [Holosporaceae bacterium]|jgi:2-amino-4-hydroxy-6-hydroxymethyldihydropteridine diphosphokinase/dihydropteroate synthase|nr:dihydropteroate synthase [Holosporaceae bacterium]
MVYLALGSNLGDRWENIETAISRISPFFGVKISSLVLETAAILPFGAPSHWNLPYLNMMVAGNTSQNPAELLSSLKKVEMEMGRSPEDPFWSPRIIDIDIVAYHDLVVQDPELSIPHKEIENRDFWQYLLMNLGYKIPPGIRLDMEKFSALNYFVLNPKFVGIVNVTPDSFSDGGKFFNPKNALARLESLRQSGARLIDLGAQSTRPNYVEISPEEEIARLSPVLEHCGQMNCLSLDSYFDEVIEYALKKCPLKWINDQNSRLSCETIKLIANRGIKLVVMLHGTDVSWFGRRLECLENLGMIRENIILDPGIGFQKTKLQSLEITKNLKRIKEFGCEILYAHSRKSFISLFSNAVAAGRDAETLAISEFVRHSVDYLRVHNVEDHMRFFVAKHQLENGVFA